MSGHVIDKRGEALMSASVLLYADSLLTPPMVCYAVTQKDGSFRLSSDTVKTGWLQVRSLGFEDCVTRVSGRQDDMKIQLKQDDRTLSEVIVKGTYTGIRVSGDTVKFDTGHFRNGFEGNVGELLDKLPGMSVSEDGRVSYGGKTISKLLLDGKDLFTKGNNGVIVKNMSADIVDGAEIIQNYKDSDLSDNFAYGSKTALNIKTKGFGKATGYADANGGYEKRYAVKAFNLGMDKKFSITSVVSGNNLGKPVFSVSDYANRILGNGDFMSGGKKSVNLSGMEAGLLYRPDNVYKDRGSVVSVDAKYNPSGKFTISGNVIYNNSGMDGKTIRDEYYLSGNTEASSISENNKRGDFLLANLNVKWKPTDNISLASEIKAGGTWMKDNTTSQSTNVETIGYRQHEWSRNFNIDWRVSMNIAYDRSLLYANADFVYTRNGNTFDLLTNKEILPVDYGAASGDMEYRLCNERKVYDGNISTEAGYIYNISTNFNVNTYLSYVYGRQRLHFIPMVAQSCKDDMTAGEYSAGISLDKTKGRFRLKLGGEATYEDNRLEGSFSNNGFKVYPVVEMEYDFNSTRKLSFSLSRDNARIDMDKLSDFDIADSYNQIVTKSKVDTPYKTSAKFFLSYFDYDIEHQMYFSVFGNMERCNDDAVPYVWQDGVVSIVSYVNDGRYDNAYIVANLEKRFAGVPLTAKGSASFNYIRSDSYMNGDKIATRIKSLKSDVRLLSNFRAMLNGELSVTYSRDWNDMGGADIRNSTDDVCLTGKLLFKSGKWKGNICLGYQFVADDSYDYDYFNLGFGLEYKMNKMSLKISAENLLNMDSMEWFRTFDTPYYYAVEKYNKMPGCLLAGIVWNY